MLLYTWSDLEYLPAEKHKTAAAARKRICRIFVQHNKLTHEFDPSIREYLGPDRMSDPNIFQSKKLPV